MALKMSIVSDKTSVAVGEQFEATVEITNEGTTDVDVSRLKVELPPQTCTSSIKDPTAQNGDSEKEEVQRNLEKEAKEKCLDTSNIPIGTIAPKAKKTMAVMSTLTSEPIVKEQELVAKTFDSKGSLLSEAKSEVISFGEPLPALTAEIVSDKDTVVKGEDFLYTIEMKNNLKADSIAAIKVIASKPAEFSKMVTLINGSIPTGGGDIFSPTVGGGLVVPDMVAGQVSTITVSVKADDVPDENPYMSVTDGTYTVQGEAVTPPEQLEESKDIPGVFVIDPELTITKSADPNQVIVGDIVEFTILVENTGNVALLDVKIVDPINPNLKFIDGSVKINGISYPNINVTNQFVLGMIDVNQVKEITFKAEVVSDTNGEANNIVYGEFTYEDNPDGVLRTQSPEILIEIWDANLDITKTVVALNDPLMLGDTATYTVFITNTGNLDAENIIFTDFLPAGVKLNPDLITVTHSTAGVFVLNNPDLDNGVFVGLLKPTETLEIVYTVEVTGGSCSGRIVNEAFANFEYEFEDGRRGSKETEHVSTSLRVGITNFSQLVLDGICTVPCQKPSMEEINDVIITSEIKSSYVVKTYSGTSNEGHILTGYKLIVNGVFNVFIEYTADLEDQPIHSFHCSIPFGNFIILPEDYELGTDVNTTVEIEDKDVNMISPREVELNLVYLLTANICN